ncbi:MULTISPECIES: NAD(P)-dependent alcohol dehydrogenase [Streptomyces]|uniref:Zinc-binding alcohol dehydrogenase n=1 Tax=Streptomyces griseus subsp. griseus (strain JCM 4626 / CBS 651.72 / NBRC 13350 / KCC S-0626 / ISP 5235) TaxID=455632 RepID=B1VSY2_STRGG|nr:NAD(P)-dependent alcohol dehydrogenase [Streptomyces griseus]MBW3703341.1 NAD(P)-dependent alcohol dehydrogenase [Streptomyces griseus]BAG17686.1 putative zinc-binding alcohol dehydrogenase [Streptomyces griseus subsp. griseus NBRC 13350]SED68270.1 aryl-alcohol dehydrogenase [Streptomyces griseus]SQA24343.1 zinc-binding alcohol dehydrogenase [Streptomyces griseus]
MTTTARAAVLALPDGPFELRDIEIEDPRPDEVLVRMVATGICATDAHVRSRRMATPLPVVLGHEGAGVVERVGSAVTSVEPGDHVVLSYHSCGRCKPCVSSHPAYCDDLWAANFAGARLDGSNGLHVAEGVEPHGHFFGQSSFSTHALAHRRNTIRVPRDLPLDVLAPLGCGLQTGAGAVLKALAVPAGASFAVFGVGAVGLAAVMAARVAGATTVVAVDVDGGRLELARALGATHLVDPVRVEDPTAALRAVEERGLEYILDTSGRAENLDAGVGALAARGKFGFVAFHEGAGAVVDAGRLTLGQSLQGIIQGDAVSSLLINDLARLYRAGRFPIDRLLSFYDFADIDAAFEDAGSGRVTKAVLRFTSPG